MIPKECKRLAEVDFPIAEVSKHAAREKSIRHGHPSTLHLWWARRPLASSRAVLMALLLPDPCDDHCPQVFKSQAREALLGMRGRPSGWQTKIASDEGLRQVLLEFIADFSNWDNAANPDYLKTGRALVRAAHPEEPPLVVDPFAGGGSIPLEALRLGCEAFASDLNPVACLILKVMLEDIPRAAIHHRGTEGTENKTKNGGNSVSSVSPWCSKTLADELRRVGGEIKAGAEKELADLYPTDPDGATPIAYLWARTVRCESPNCGAEIPLLRSLWLCKKAKRRRALRAVIRHRDTEGTEKGKRGKSLCSLCLRGEFPHVAFEIFEPASEKEVAGGTVARAKASCLCCGTVLPPDRVRAQLAEQKGGADVIFHHGGTDVHHRDTENTEKKGDKNENAVPSVSPWCRIGGARMTAVVTLRPGEQGRHYRLPTEADYAAVRRAQQRVAEILSEWERGGRQGLCPIPDEALPPIGTLGFRVQRYGILQWGDLFTARQKVALVGLGRLTTETQRAQRKEVAEAMALAVSRCTEQSSSLVRWRTTVEAVAGTFGRQALPMMWDFTEIVTTGTYGSNFTAAVEWVGEVVDAWHGSFSGQAQSADATDHPLPDQSAGVWFTDPPYYDAIPYSDLSDFFLVWLKRTLPGHPLLRDPFDPDNPLSPKIREAVQDETKQCDGRAKDRVFFEDTMGKAFAEGRRILKEDGIGSVVFAHKTTEGWEALLSGMILGGWTITGSWPIATERPGRLRSQSSAALATSVHLICRPRPEDAPVGDWADVLRELPQRVAAWIERLQGEGIRGADLVFACIGPALEIFSRYRAVETAEGRKVGLPEYLEKVWEVVGRAALEQVLGSAEAGSLEEDARLVALFLWTLQSTHSGEIHHGDTESTEKERDKNENSVSPWWNSGFSLPFDIVRRFAQPMGIDLDVWTGRVIGQDKGIVRLLPVAERSQALFGQDGAGAAADWIEGDPGADLQGVLFPGMEEDSPQRHRGHRGRKKILMDEESLSLRGESHATTLDRVHAAMLFQSGGQAHALRKLLAAEQDRGPDFLRLANALSALYPKGAEEKRLLDAMLLAVPR